MFEQQVARGAEVLDDELGPGWPLLLDLGKLDMANCQACVLGQLMGDYELGLEKLTACDYYGGSDLGFDIGIFEALETTDEILIRFGDSARETALAGLYMDLEETWLKVVKDRLDKGVTLDG
jgi:hypothetical protein